MKVKAASIAKNRHLTPYLKIGIVHLNCLR
jgi:hypothetical protein